ncbi:MAG: DNA modification methylase [Alphaproteobacteria bacterium]|nr:DNA modification methylase [Alphaproteobacteria bacterium]
MTETSLKIQNIPTDKLVEYARNPRKNDAVVDKMIACIKEFGFRIPIVAKSDGTVVDGHLRLKAARKIGLKEVPVVNADDLTEAQIKAFRLVANQSANWAEWDEELLKLEFKELDDLDFDLELTGFDLDEIEKYLQDDKDIQEDNFNEDEIFEESKKVITKPGNLWILSNHRLLCGDSTNENNVKKLMNNQIADMIFTDPPYNLESDRLVRADILRHDDFLMAAGKMSEQEYTNFLDKVFKNLISESKDGSIHYICMDWRHVYEVMTAAKNNYSEFKQLCVWNKKNMGLGSFYRNKHELVFVFKNGTAEHTTHIGAIDSARTRTNVWEYASMNSYGADDRTELSALHPTVKPVRLVADAILDCSNRSDLILDLFGGSGTTMIACEETDRKCYMMEIDPKYCDVSIRRWQKLTGQQAILEANGKTFYELSEKDG